MKFNLTNYYTPDTNDKFSYHLLYKVALDGYCYPIEHTLKALNLLIVNGANLNLFFNKKEVSYSINEMDDVNKSSETLTPEPINVKMAINNLQPIKIKSRYINDLINGNRTLDDMIAEINIATLAKITDSFLNLKDVRKKLF
jgi:hypothetical protein